MLLSQTKYPPVNEWLEKSLTPVFNEGKLKPAQFRVAQIICQRFSGLRMQCEMTSPSTRKTAMPLVFRGENAVIIFFGASLDLVKISRQTETGVTYSLHFNLEKLNESVVSAYLDKAYRMITTDSMEYPPTFERGPEKLTCFLVYPIGVPGNDKLKLVSQDEHFVYYSIL